jgi:putative heme-binding domain-containing protein
VKCLLALSHWPNRLSIGYNPGKILSPFGWLPMARSLLAVATLVFIFSPVAADDIVKAKRVLWTTGKITGSPEPPPPYATPRVFPNAKFYHPLLIARMHGSDLLFIGEQDGKISSVITKQPDAKPVLFVDLKANYAKLKPHPGAKEFEFVYGLAFHPKFAENHYCYISYTLKGKKGAKTGPFDPEKNLPEGTRVSRFTVNMSGERPTVDLATEEVIITFEQGGHNGADLHFGPDGFLYISTGDAADPNPPDPFKTGTDCSDLLASILRIDVDHKDAGLNYAIPKDNPFIGMSDEGKPVRPEIWSYGYRNPWRMSFDRHTGELWVGDVGWEQWEMVHKPTKGSNQGWSVMEARSPMNTHLKLGPTPNVTPPAIEIDHTMGASVTGGYVYRGKKFPELYGKYIFGDYMTKRIWAASFKGDRLDTLVDLTEPTVRISSFGEDNDGEIYLLDYDTGTIHTLEKNVAPSYDPKQFPKTLSATGLYSNVQTEALAPGVTPFLLNAEAWHDGAMAERFFAVPGDGKILDIEGRKQLGGNIDWLPFQFHFPKDSVLGKTLTLRTEAGIKKIETQILHYDGRYWQAYTYQWRDDQTDADLVPADGGEKEFVVPDPRVPGGKRQQTWNFASRVQCLTCHTPWAEVSLGFSSLNLNRPGFDGRNQLVALCESGFMDRVKGDNRPNKPYDDAAVKKLDKLVNPHDDQQKIEDRARSYLHVNCSHCHRNGGGGSLSFELTKWADLKKGVLDSPPTRGSFGIEKARIIASGEPHKSTLVYRMAKFGRDRMPHIGAELPDAFGLELIHDWILHLADGKPPPATQLEVGIMVAAKKGFKGNEPMDLKVFEKLPPGPLRELFEGYLPHTGERKLGPNPRPRAILSLTGDADRGKELFFTVRNQCANCHQIDGKGIAVGPDLSKIGKDRSREELLESLLDPSRRVEAKYQSYNVKTEDGRAITGVIVAKDAKGVTIRDALGKDTVVTNDNLASLKPSALSLMANGLLSDFTPQQAADLLAFLTSRK